MYLIRNTVNNSITDAGCRYIAEGPWSNLRFLNLGTVREHIENNKIGPVGTRWLAKAKWERLEYLNLC